MDDGRGQNRRPCERRDTGRGGRLRKRAWRRLGAGNRRVFREASGRGRDLADSKMRGIGGPPETGVPRLRGAATAGARNLLRSDRGRCRRRRDSHGTVETGAAPRQADARLPDPALRPMRGNDHARGPGHDLEPVAGPRAPGAAARGTEGAFRTGVPAPEDSRGRMGDSFDRRSRRGRVPDRPCVPSGRNCRRIRRALASGADLRERQRASARYRFAIVFFDALETPAARDTGGIEVWPFLWFKVS